MTKKRQAQFEAERQKMLASIGLEPEESFIAEKEEEEVEKEEDQNQKDFSETLEDLKADNPSADEYDARAAAAYDAYCDFENSLMDKSEEEAEKARKVHHNQHVRAKERLEDYGPVNAFGGVIKALDQFQAKAGGGPIYIAYVVLVCGPLFTYWTDTYNFILALAVLGISMFVGRLGAIWLSYIVRPIVHIANAIGPRFICEIRKGSISLKTMVSVQTKSLIFFTNIHYPLFAFMFLAFSHIHKTEDGWIYNYFHNMGYALLISAIAWVFANFIVYPRYVGYIKRTLSENQNVSYQLRYLDDRSRVMIPTRTGKMIDKKEILKAFQRDAAGIA